MLYIILQDVFREVYKFIGEPFCSAVAETNKLPLDFREEMKKELTKIPVLELLQPTRFVCSDLMPYLMGS